MDINRDGDNILIEELPDKARKLLEETDFFKDLEDKYEDDYEYTIKKIRMVVYPTNIPIVFSDLEYGRTTKSGVVATHNLKKGINLKNFATSTTFYEKLAKDEVAYAILNYRDYDYDESLYSLVEISN